MEFIHLKTIFEELYAENKIKWICEVENLLYVGKQYTILIYNGFKLQEVIDFVYPNLLFKTYRTGKTLYIPHLKQLYMFYLTYQDEYILCISDLKCIVIKIMNLQINRLIYESIVNLLYYDEIIYLDSYDRLFMINLNGEVIKILNHYACQPVLFYNNKLIIRSEDGTEQSLLTTKGEFIKPIKSDIIRSYTMHNNVLHIGKYEGCVDKIINDEVIEIIRPQMKKGIISHLFSYSSYLIVVNDSCEIEFLDKEYKTRKFIILSESEQVVKLFEYNNNLYIATTERFYVYGEYYPYLEPELPEYQKPKTKNWIKLLGSRPVIQKDLHFLFERELLK